MRTPLTIPQFQARWRGVALTERAASQSHFIDLCHALGVSTLVAADPTGQTYQIAVACPFCRVMLSDALTSQQAAGSAPRASKSWTSRGCCWPPSGAEPPPDPASPTPCVPKYTSACKVHSGTHGGGGAGKILKKNQAWLSIRR